MNSPTTQTDGSLSCPECGMLYPAPEAHCSNCGLLVEDDVSGGWRVWLPGLLLVLVGGGLLFVSAWYWESFGWGVVLTSPFTVGCVLGYGVRVRKLVLVSF